MNPSKILQKVFSFDYPANFTVSINDNLDIMHFDADAALIE